MIRPANERIINEWLTETGSVNNLETISAST